VSDVEGPRFLEMTYWDAFAYGLLWGAVGAMLIVVALKTTPKSLEYKYLHLTAFFVSILWPVFIILGVLKWLVTPMTKKD